MPSVLPEGLIVKHFDLVGGVVRPREGEARATAMATGGAGQAVLVVIDRRDLARECLSRWLAHEFPGRRIASLKQLAPDDEVFEQRPELVVLAPGPVTLFDAGARQQVDLCRQRWRSAPLVVISERESADEVMQALQLGVRGYIPAGLAASIVVEALRLVAAGGSFIPPSVLSATRPAAAPPAKPGTTPRFTPRQREVLDRLSRGESNKAIAHELSMSENTVKVHIRHIMRKLGVSNRTQIALRSQTMAGLGGA